MKQMDLKDSLILVFSILILSLTKPINAQNATPDSSFLKKASTPENRNSEKKNTVFQICNPF